MVGTTAITFALLAAARRGVTAFVTQRERLEQLATLGRFSAQMAHDLKNPIAALKGAAQYLKEEHARGQLLGRARASSWTCCWSRWSGWTGWWARTSASARVEPLRRPLDLNRLVEGVLSLQAFAGRPARWSSSASSPPGLPRCAGDEDLLANALENLVRNAFEAMPAGGTLTVRTRRGRRRGVVLSVEDTGEGMDARTRERAFDDFFTTKATGSGLGLAFVRRVVEAHGGEVVADEPARAGVPSSACACRRRLPSASPASEGEAA